MAGENNGLAARLKPGEVERASDQPRYGLSFCLQRNHKPTESGLKVSSESGTLDTKDMNVPTAQPKLAAIMFTDTVGYSALSSRDEKLAQGLLEEQRRSLRQIWGIRLIVLLIVISFPVALIIARPFAATPHVGALVGKMVVSSATPEDAR